jgi:hypothetical protein
MNTVQKTAPTKVPASASSKAGLLKNTLAWLDRNLAATLATTLIFMSSASLFSLLEAFH